MYEASSRHRLIDWTERAVMLSGCQARVTETGYGGVKRACFVLGENETYSVYCALGILTSASSLTKGINKPSRSSSSSLCGNVQSRMMGKPDTYLELSRDLGWLSSLTPVAVRDVRFLLLIVRHPVSKWSLQ